MSPLRAFCAAVLIAVLAMLTTSRASADSLQITPLQYRAALKVDEKQKGYVDISNPTNEPVSVAFEVQAFRQVNNQGGVEFYADDRISSGILLDLESVDLAPRETLRLFFLIDGTKLASGAVFAAILAHTVPTGEVGSAQSVRVGTILEIEHGSIGAHSASIVDFSASFFQVSEKLSATFVVRNDDTSKASGFRPRVRVDIAPYSTQNVEGPLVFAGRERTVEYRTSGNFFGPIWLQAGTDSSSQGRLIFAATGYWRWLGPLVVTLVIAMVGLIVYVRRKKH